MGILIVLNTAEIVQKRFKKTSNRTTVVQNVDTEEASSSQKVEVSA